MIDGFPIINYSVYISGLMLSCLGALMLLVFGKSIEIRTNRCFFLFFLILAIDMVFNIIAETLIGDTNQTSITIHYTMEMLHRIFSPFLAYIIAYYLVRLAIPDKRLKPYLITLFVMYTTYVGFLLIAQINNSIFSIDSSGNLQRNSLYLVLAILSCMPIVLSIVLLIKGKNLTSREKIAFWFYCALPAGSVLIQAFIKGVYLIIPATIVAGLVAFIVIVADHTRSYYIQEQEQIEMSVALMLSQIQPHFLFNTLNVIYGLSAEEKAENTKQAIALFSDYLRGNIKSLRQKELVHFSEELRHTQLYLTLEKMSMGDRLHFEFDCQEEDFFLPVLTLQPLVENAVLHGVSMKAEGGNVKITTRIIDGNIVITIYDDGVSFSNSEKSSNHTHIGIENVRNRLAIKCGGSLSIKSTPSEGTTVTITIPKEES